jgi:hypothetical protein
MKLIKTSIFVAIFILGLAVFCQAQAIGGAPDFNVKDISGQTVKLSELKGRAARFLGHLVPALPGGNPQPAGNLPPIQKQKFHFDQHQPRPRYSPGPTIRQGKGNELDSHHRQRIKRPHRFSL